MNYTLLCPFHTQLCMINRQLCNGQSVHGIGSHRQQTKQNTDMKYAFICLKTKSIVRVPK